MSEALIKLILQGVDVSEVFLHNPGGLSGGFHAGAGSGSGSAEASFTRLHAMPCGGHSTLTIRKSSISASGRTAVARAGVASFVVAAGTRR